MTDMYGNEPHDQAGHDEVVGGDHAEVHEAPSDYEFADDGGATSEHSDEHVLPMTEAKAKGRSALLPIAAAVGGVILLGGVAWWQFGGALMSGNNATDAAMPMPQEVAAAPVAPASAPSLPQGSLEVAPKVADTSSVAPATTPQPVAVAPEPMPAPIPAPLPQLTAPVPAQPVPTMGMAPAAGDQRIDALTSRIDDLQKSLSQVTQQLSQVSTMVASAAPDKGIEDRLDRLEQHTAQNHHAAPTLSAPATLTVDDNGMAPAPMVAPTPKPVHHKPVSETHAVSHHAAHTHKPVVVEGKEEPVHWVLRAAMPGQAWIATSGNSSDLKPLHVGDTMASIGLVTAIEQKGGAWIVEGTKGTIR